MTKYFAETVNGGSAEAVIVHMRPRGSKLLFDANGFVDRSSAHVLHEQHITNIISNAGRIYQHNQIYGAPTANGLNWIALSADASAPSAASTTLIGEITTNGLVRAQGAVTLPTGSGNQTAIARTFTATGAQLVRKAALFSASSAGTMNHELLLTTPRSLEIGDALAVTYIITLG